MTDRFLRTIGFLHVDVERCDDLWEGEVLRHGARNPHLIDAQVRIRRDDSSRAEVHTFTHQVSSNATFLSFQSHLH